MGMYFPGKYFSSPSSPSITSAPLMIYLRILTISWSFGFAILGFSPSVIAMIDSAGGTGAPATWEVVGTELAPGTAPGRLAPCSPGGVAVDKAGPGGIGEPGTAAADGWLSAAAACAACIAAVISFAFASHFATSSEASS